VHNLQNFTISAWVYPTQERDSYQTIIEKSASSTYGDQYNDDLNYQLRINSNSTKVTYRYDYSSCGSTHSLTSNSELILNQWNHILLVHDYDNSDLNLYINGNLDKSGTAKSSICTTDNPVIVGEAFVGKLDEVAIYGKALDSAEAEALYDYQSTWYDVTSQHFIQVDADDPEVELDLALDYLRNEAQILSILASDNTSPITAVQYRLDSGSWQDATADGAGWYFTFDPAALATALGDHTIQVRATDSVAHTTTAAARTVTVESTAPTVTIDATLTSGPLAITDTITLFGTATDSGSGLDASSVRVSLADYSGADVMNPTMPTVSGDDWSVDHDFATAPYGVYTMTVVASDNLSHTTTVAEAIQLDGYAPIADLVSSAYVITSATTALVGTVSDLHAPVNSKTLHLHFEESSGSTTFDDGSLTRAAASCPSTGSGSATCPTSGATGQRGSALTFDGSDDWLALDGLTIDGSTVATLTHQLDLYNASFTVLAWVKPASNSGDQAILGSAGSADNQALFIGLRNGIPIMDFGNNSFRAGSALSTGTWHHLAWRYSYDSTTDSGTMALYIDGILAGSESGHSPFVGEDDLTIGRAQGTNYFAGDLDELTIYGKALTSDDLYHIAHPLTTTNVAELLVRLRHASEMDQTESEGEWLTATLGTEDAFFTTWSLDLDDTLDAGSYNIDLKATDSLGNSDYVKGVWNGEIDRTAPVIDFTFEVLTDGYARVQCSAVDLNLITSDWTCPNNDSTIGETT
ncbi:MAG: hypothetical protein KDE58_21320, partial [Caldilineaceae bacterium]|nr:hypothetical protein [Caldilineaceae bacterium]